MRVLPMAPAMTGSRGMAAMFSLQTVAFGAALLAGGLEIPAERVADPDEAGRQAVWWRLPSATDMEAAYPAAARDQHLYGQVLLRCIMSRDATPGDCTVVSQAPAGAGFAAAALTLVPKFQAQKLTTGGGPVVGKAVHIPFTFVQLADAAPTAGPEPREGKFRGGEPGPYLPERAYRTGLGGLVILECGIDAKGRLAPCALVYETPQNVNFADAALHMANIGRLTAEPRLVDGKPVERETARIMVRFKPAKPR